MIYAEVVGKSILDYHNTDYGFFALKVASDGSDNTNAKAQSVLSELLHAFGMWFAWCLLPLGLVASNRWLHHKGDRLQYVHSAIGVFILCITLACELIIVIRYSPDGFFYDNLHTLFGWLALIMVTLVVIGGLAAYRFK